MADKLWKAAERKIASLLGGKRVPVTGRQRGDAPDIAHPVFGIEVKNWKEFPAWLLDALNQAQQSSKEGQIPLVILHMKGTKYEDSLTIMALRDTIRLMERDYKEVE